MALAGDPALTNLCLSSYVITLLLLRHCGRAQGHWRRLVHGRRPLRRVGRASHRQSCRASAQQVVADAARGRCPGRRRSVPFEKWSALPQSCLEARATLRRSPLGSRQSTIRMSPAARRRNRACRKEAERLLLWAIVEHSKLCPRSRSRNPSRPHDEVTRARHIHIDLATPTLVSIASRDSS